jgi:DivIVA domain-containing protein
VEWFIAVVVVAALGVAAIVAAGGLGSMSAEPTRDVFRQDLPSDRALTGVDLQRLRFGVALRGYSMSQVDDVLDRLSGELAERDRRIADLEALLDDRGMAPPGLAQPGLTQPGLAQHETAQPGFAQHETARPPIPERPAERAAASGSDAGAQPQP